MQPVPGATHEPPLRVLLIGNYAPDRQQSMQRYARELAAGLAEAGVQVTCVAPPAFFGRLAFGRPSLAKWLGHLDKYAVFVPRLLASRGRFDIVHIADHANAPYRRWFRHDPIVVTCHDLFAVRGMLGLLPDHRPRSSGRQLQRMILRALRTCPAIICVSRTTAEDARALLQPDLLEVIPNAIRHELGTLPPARVEAALAAAGVEQPYFLHVGGNQFYKNRPGAVRVFDLIAEHPDYAGHRLVLAGKAPDAALAAAIAGARHRDRITTLVQPEDATIEALYTRATALLFLSTAEGFGWPIVEAQACGCVVAAADREPMRGIGGGATILIDPEDEPDAAQRIIAGLATAMERRAEGLRNAAHYRPDRVFEQYLDVYHRMLGRPLPIARRTMPDAIGGSMEA